MKKTLFLLPVMAIALIAIVTTGCQWTVEPVSEEQIDAEAVAWLITDPANGLTQEVADLGSYLFGVDGSVQNVAPQDSTVESKALGPESQLRHEKDQHSSQYKACF